MNSIDSTSHAEGSGMLIDKDIQPKIQQKLQTSMHFLYHNNSKPEMMKNITTVDEEVEQEKKLIALSTKTAQFATSNNITLQQNNRFKYTNKTTKEVKQDYDLTIEKEKKLIAASVKDSENEGRIADANKPSKVPNSAELHGHAKATFQSRYFEKKGRKVIKQYKEDKLASLLDAIKFGKAPSTVKKTMEFRYLKQCGLFVEDYNVTKTGESWSGGILSQYKYIYEIPEHFSKCSTAAWFNHTDMRGSVFLSFQVRSILGNTMMNNARVCSKYCCHEPRCKAWTLRIQEGETRNCDKGAYCCWLKSAVPEVHSGVDNSTSGIVDRVHTKHPPTGMRSAVPLGGITTGSFELHADGTFHEWTIENQSPGGSAKLNNGALNMALLGVHVTRKNTSEAALLRTHPPQGYPGVEALSYSGAYPVTKLTPVGRITDQLKMDLYAYSSFQQRNPYHSAIPSVAFTLSLENQDQHEPMNVSFLLNLPLGYQDDTIRIGDNFGEVVFTKKILPSQCAKACAKMPKCMAWTTNGPTACLLKDKMPLHAWQNGIISGLKGVWSKNGSTLNMKRPGFFPQSGSTTLYAVGGEGETTSFAVADDFGDVWNHFAETGLAGNTTNITKFGLHGSASIQTSLQPGQKKSLTIIMSWHYPNRDHANVNIGNFYSNLFTSSKGVALHMREHLLQTVTNILEWQAPFLLPSSFVEKHNHVTRLPLWLSDVLMNSVSFWRSSFWTKDGRWRQWEAYDCNDIDTIHNDMQRILPYMLFYPA
ncbi:hypothetical protein QZH41_014759 [Actinostola sp. cb2023]|nr:hypothetical protein QZH41_014759 [Actinostola sp. cb2023]